MTIYTTAARAPDARVLLSQHPGLGRDGADAVVALHGHVNDLDHFAELAASSAEHDSSPGKRSAIASALLTHELGGVRCFASNESRTQAVAAVESAIQTYGLAAAQQMMARRKKRCLRGDHDHPEQPSTASVFGIEQPTPSPQLAGGAPSTPTTTAAAPAPPPTTMAEQDRELAKLARGFEREGYDPASARSLAGRELMERHRDHKATAPSESQDPEQPEPTALQKQEQQIVELARQIKKERGLDEMSARTEAARQLNEQQLAQQPAHPAIDQERAQLLRKQQNAINRETERLVELGYDEPTARERAGRKVARDHPNLQPEMQNTGDAIPARKNKPEDV